MLKLIAKSVGALALLTPASFAAPAWAGNSIDERKCRDAKHRHAKPVAAAPARKAGARSVTIIEKRKLDIQILSFGP